jgi:hypothetical protein
MIGGGIAVTTGSAARDLRSLVKWPIPNIGPARVHEEA